MDNELTLKAYELIRLNIFNPTGKNGSIAKELNEKYYLEPNDLIQQLIILFIEKKHNLPINNLQAYISVFTKNALLDIKKSEEASKLREEHVGNYGWGKPDKY